MTCTAQFCNIGNYMYKIEIQSIIDIFGGSYYGKNISASNALYFRVSHFYLFHEIYW